MFKSRFFRRLYIPYVLLICAVALIIGFLGALRLREAHIDQARTLLRNTASVVADLIEPELARNDTAAVQRSVRDLGQRLGYRVTVIGSDPNGTVLADSEADPAHMVPHRYRPEVVTAFTRGEGWDIRVSDTIHTKLLYCAYRVDVNGQPAYIRLAIHLNDLDASLRMLYLSIALAAIACMLAAALISYYVARRQAVPIVEVSEFADAVSHGQFDHRILRSEPGELGDLARSLNTMADNFTRLLADAEKDKADLRAILSSMSEGIIATDASKRILLINDSAAQLLALPPDSAGKAIWELLRDEHIIKAVDQVATSGQQRQVHLTPSPNRHLELTICPVTYSPTARKSPGLILVVHDITQAMRYPDLRREFVANVSHELRTPLTVIKGYVETLRDGAISDPARRDQYLATIERHANQLTNLVSDLLELSRLDSQAALPRQASVDLVALCRHVAELLQPAIANRQHTLTLDLPAATPPILGNTDYLERAIVNLLDNAVKYTPTGGQLRIAICTQSPHAIIEVTDNGLGIPEHDLPRIFERFYRVDRSRSREMGGTGLGLAIVKHIVQSHGGTVEVTSHLNTGSTFRLLLPLAKQL